MLTQGLQSFQSGWLTGTSCFLPQHSGGKCDSPVVMACPALHNDT